MTAHEFAGKHLYPFKAKGAELIPDFCPYCHGGDHRDKETFALNTEKLTFNCRRGSCGVQGHFVELCRHFGEQADTDNRPRLMTTKRYKAPEKKPETITENALAYLALRKISPETVQRYGVGMDLEGNLMFPYYDENGDHVFNKFRAPRKLDKAERKMWREKDTKPVLFGMHLCNPEFPLTITEGEIDAMSCHEAGIANAVSVPSGAEDFTWMDTCWEFLERFQCIYLFGDNDAAGEAMIRKLKAKLSGHRLFVVKHEEKDANLLLYKGGQDAVLLAWTSAEEIPVTGLINLANVVPLDVRNIPKSHTSIKGLDRLYGGFMMGDVTVWTGKRGEGKSTVLSQLMLDALQDGRGVCAYSGELRSDRFQYWTDLQAAGSDNVLEYFDEPAGKAVRYVERNIRDSIHNWYDYRYWLYDNSATLESEESGVIKIFEKAAKRYDCTVFLIDNLMTVEYGTIHEKDFNLLQTKFVNQLAAFANLYNVHVHLVAHPRKTQNIESSDEVSGTGNITNRAANVISVNRCDPNSSDACDVKLIALKNRWEGQLGEVKLLYDEKSRRIHEPGTAANLPYGWTPPTQTSITEEDDAPW